MTRLLIVTAICLSAFGCRDRGAPAAPAAGPKSPAGWDVRYNAALALAYRGSDKVVDPVVWESLTEMLDEAQQLRNFSTQLANGREVPDETAARLTVIGALKAVQALHRKNPKIDLSPLAAPIAKLAQSPSAPVRTEAAATQLTLANK
jgi:hypothetical protein